MSLGSARGPSPVAQFPVECLARPTSARALCAEERQTVRTVLNSERFQDCSPAAVNATLLDEGQYLCSVRTMRERRDQITHPQYEKPELLAAAPNQLWIWDITKRRGPAKMLSAATWSGGWWRRLKAPN